MSPAKKQLPCVALLIETTHAFGRGLLRGIGRYVQEHGAWQIYRDPPFYLGGFTHKERLKAIRQWQPDGLILREQLQGNDDYLALGVPTVYSSWQTPPVEGIPNLIEPPEAVGSLGAEYFRNRGYHDFAYLGVPGMFWSRMRGEAFARRVEALGGICHAFEYSGAQQGERQALASWLESLPKPVALMTATDDRSLDVVETARSLGLHVPEDIAVLGVNDDRLICDMSPVPLSSIQLNEETLGYQSAAALDTLMRGKAVPPQPLHILPNQVVTRQSSEVLAVKDRQVVQAVSFIHQNYHRSIGVGDVAAAASLHRRVLENRFRRHLDTTVYGLVQHVRMQQAAAMLVETEVPIGRIAASCGFSELKQFSRSFQQFSQTNPRAYREAHRKRGSGASGDRALE